MSVKQITLIVLAATVVVLIAGTGPRIIGSVKALPPAQQPEADGLTVPYPGQLLDEAAKPVADGAYDFNFALYESETGGDPLWSESQAGVIVGEGAFYTSLGSVKPIPAAVLSGPDLWLATSVRGPEHGEFTALAPRQRLSAEASVAPASASSGMACPHDHFGETWLGNGTGLIVSHAPSGAAILMTDDNIGVRAHSRTNWGIDASGKDGYLQHGTGDLLLGGNLGEIVAEEELDLYSAGHTIVRLDTDMDSDSRFQVASAHAWGASMWVDETGDLWVLGDLMAAGSKPAIVDTSSFGSRKLYAVESPEVWFEDLGSASLTDGDATVAFEPIFAETVNLEEEYHVFLTPLCEEPLLLFVTEKIATGFAVRGVTLNNEPSHCAFDYRVAAKRRGYEDVRLEIFAQPSIDADN